MFLQPLSAELSCCCTVWHSSASVPPPTSLRLIDPGRPLACGLPPARTPMSLARRESSASLPVVQCPLVSCSFLVSHREKENLIPENPSVDGSETSQEVIVWWSVQSMVYQLPVAAGTNHHELRSFKRQMVILSQARSQSLTSRCWRNRIPHGGFRRKSGFRPFRFPAAAGTPRLVQHCVGDVLKTRVQSHP